MAQNFWKVVNEVMESSDVLIMLLDARMVQETRNPEVEAKVKALKKPLIYVLTKGDLIEEDKIKKSNLNPVVCISATKHLGISRLRERILIEAKKAYKDKKDITVGVLGYPNVGKSSLINSMKGRKSAPTSPMSGFTKGKQLVKADNRITFLDTPGVLPYMEKDQSKHALIGTIEFSKVKDPEMVAIELIEKFPGKIEKYYQVEISDDPEETLETIASKHKMLSKGAKPDAARAARMILKDWQAGKIQ